MNFDKFGSCHDNVLKYIQKIEKEDLRHFKTTDDTLLVDYPRYQLKNYEKSENWESLVLCLNIFDFSFTGSNFRGEHQRA